MSFFRMCRSFGVRAVTLEGSSVWAWGLNNNGRLGNSNTNQQNAPVKIMDGVYSVSTQALILKTDGSLWVCGDNQYGQLVDGVVVQRTLRSAC